MCKKEELPCFLYLIQIFVGSVLHYKERMPGVLVAGTTEKSVPPAAKEPKPLLWHIKTILIDYCDHTATSRPRLCVPPLHTVSFDWFLSGLEWILDLEFCELKLLFFYQKWLWNIRSKLNSFTFWVFEPIFRYIWSKSSFHVQKASILI